MHILFITSWYPSGKNPVSGVFVKELAKAASLYDDIIVLHALADKIKGIYEISDNREDDIRVVRVKYKMSGTSFVSYLLYMISIFIAFIRIRKEYLDLIHAHVYFPAGIMAIILGKIFKLPVIIEEHAEIVDKYRQYNVWKKLKDFVRVKLAKFTLNKAQLLVIVSKSLQEHIESFGIKSRCKIVPNVVNMRFFSQTPKNKDGKKRIIFIGILTPRKGIPYLLDAIKIVISKRKDFFLDIVGNGPFIGDYKRMAEELDITEVVKFHGKITDVKKLKLLQTSDFMVLPSLYESFGVVLIEAMACGKPVITTLSGGQKEFVNKDNGILVPPKDSEALAEAIDYMLDHYSDYSPEKISRYVLERFSPKVVGRQLHETYLEVIKGGV